jgi:dihydroorotase
MHLKDLGYLELPASADMHVHLRHGELMDLIVRDADGYSKQELEHPQLTNKK